MIRRAARRTALFVVALAFVGCAWELYKLIGPDDGGSVLGMRLIPKASDRAMPHTWDIFRRLAEPENRGGDDPIALTVAGYAWYTFRLSFVGLLLGAAIGIGLAVLMARFRIVERGLLPWVIMSQTVPLIALAPQVVSWSGRLDLFGFTNDIVEEAWTHLNSEAAADSSGAGYAPIDVTLNEGGN